MLLAAALLAAGCTNEVEGNQIDKLELELVILIPKYPSERNMAERSIFYGLKVMRFL